MHDAAMLAESGFLCDLNLHAFSPMCVPLCIYGDPAYPLRIHLQAHSETQQGSLNKWSCSTSQ